MKFKNILIIIMILAVSMQSVVAAPFNLPTSWILTNNGTSIDTNNNGYPDYADNVLNASYAGTATNALKLGGELPSFYLDYDEMNAGTIADSFIDGSAGWDAKGGTGVCGAGFFISEVTTSGVVCTAESVATTYSAGDYMDLTGTVFSVDVDTLAPFMENKVLISYQNITNLPTCSGDDKLSFDGTTLSCETDQDHNTQLSSNQVKDYAWSVLSGSQSGITVVYNTTTRTVSYVVDSTAVSDLTDVLLTGLADGEVLVYNATTSKWENGGSVGITYTAGTGLNLVGDEFSLDTTYTDGRYLQSYTETDPVWLLAKGDYYTKTNVYNKTEIDNAGYLTSYTETDPVWNAIKGYYYNSTQVDALPVSTFSNDAGYLVDGEGGVWNTSVSNSSNIYYNDGNVGIGTDNPEYLLDINGVTRMGDGVLGPKLIIDGGGPFVTSNDMFVIKSGSYPYMQFLNNATGGKTTDGFKIGIESKLGAYIWNRENSPMSFGTNNNIRMKIDDNGKIGIGTTTPQSILNLNGGTGALSTGLSFGDGDTGIYESSDDNLAITANTVTTSGTLTSTYFIGDGSLLTNLPVGSESDPVWVAAKPNYYNKTEVNALPVSTFTNDAGYITSYTETDPVFVGSDVYDITNTEQANWNTAYSWGNHALAGYLTSYTETDPVWIAAKDNYYINSEVYNKTEVDALPVSTFPNDAGYITSATADTHVEGDGIYLTNDTTTMYFDESKMNTTIGTIASNLPVSTFTNDAGYLTSYTETDPVFVGSDVYDITNTEQANWNTAYSWGNHALAGYLTSYTETDPVWTSDKASYYTKTESDAKYPDVLTSNTGRLIEACDYTGTCLNDTGLQTAIVKTITYGTVGQYATSNAANGLLYTSTIPASDITGLSYFTNSDETDQVFVASDAFDITNTEQANWNTAYSWGNHALVGYLTSYTETDPVWIAAKDNYYNNSEVYNKTEVYNQSEVYTQSESESRYVNTAGDTMTGDLNMSSHNITTVDCITFKSGGMICSN